MFFTFILFPQDATTDKSANQQSSSAASQIKEEVKVQNEESQKPKNGWELYLDGRFNDSIKMLIEEKKTFPDRVNIYVILGWNYYYLKRYKEMENISLEGIKLAPNDMRIVKNLAEAYYFQSMFMEAVSYFERYIKNKFNENDSYISTAYNYLGNCYYNMKLYRKADTALSTVNYYKPRDLRINLILADINEKLNEKEKARKFYETVLALDPSNTQAQDGLKRVKNTQ